MTKEEDLKKQNDLRNDLVSHKVLINVTIKHGSIKTKTKDVHYVDPKINVIQLMLRNMGFNVEAPVVQTVSIDTIPVKAIDKPSQQFLYSNINYGKS